MPGGSFLRERFEVTSLTARRAAVLIALLTVITAVLGGVLGWLLDRKDFPTLGEGMWWSLQTVTTVGYGDVVPHSAWGRILGGMIMLSGIAFIAVVTAAVTAALVESARRRRGHHVDRGLHDRLEQMDARLARIELALGQRSED
jgi:voltage-gated potassium channel